MKPEQGFHFGLPGIPVVQETNYIFSTNVTGVHQSKICRKILRPNILLASAQQFLPWHYSFYVIDVLSWKQDQ